ncbi:GNAT family N-acetyltransferase [Alkalicoccus chagannorensis]|uniref:GNAT family N-acetyltransferase n=1 Tax=Alkalicoccus chagannorensis TaxID=427072 RepID=UPI00040A6E32|nr:GNAT family N-acetyltransferase [Alkalicoccus chagannorensis]
MPYQIRLMQQEDTAAVQEVAAVTWHDTYDGLIPEAARISFLNEGYSDSMLARRREKSLFLVAEEGGTVIGFANFSFVNQEGKAGLGALYIHPDHQGRGVGSALLEAGKAELKGLQELFVDVEKDNRSGRRFYEAKGFRFLREFDDPIDGYPLISVEMMWTPDPAA